MGDRSGIQRQREEEDEMNILRVCADEFLVTDHKEVFRVMSRDGKLEVESASLYNIHEEVCKGCARQPETFYVVCKDCPREVERR